jgi:hypothetical protein
MGVGVSYAVRPMAIITYMIAMAHGSLVDTATT